MYEELAPKRSGAFRNVFLIVLCGFIFLSLPGWIPSLFDFPYGKAIYEFLVILFVVLLIFRFVRSYGTEYKYALMDSVLVIRTKSGNKETVVLEATLTKDSQLIPYPDAKQAGKTEKVFSYGVSDKSTAYFLTFPMQNGKSAVIFQPSQKFVEILQQLLLDKREKM